MLSGNWSSIFGNKIFYWEYVGWYVSSKYLLKSCLMSNIILFNLIRLLQVHRRIELLLQYYVCNCYVCMCIHKRIFKVFPPNFVSRLEIQIPFILYASIDANRKELNILLDIQLSELFKLKLHSYIKKIISYIYFSWSNTLLSSSWILTLLSLLCFVQYKIYNNLKSTFIIFCMQTRFVTLQTNNFFLE